MIVVQPANIENWESLVCLFEGSKECAECWCMNHRSNPKTCPTNKIAKEALKQALGSGDAHGLLAFVNGMPAGWCAIDPVHSQIGHDFNLKTSDPIDTAAWMIHCLYVDPRFRGHGVSKELVRSAIVLARSAGAEKVLAFPIPEDSKGRFPKDLAEFSGRFSTYQKMGFETKQRLDDFYQTVSLKL